MTDARPHRNVVIGGLTAAGKTTHAKKLAAEIGYEYVSGTGTLCRLLDIEVEEDPPPWVNVAAQVAKLRTDETDRALEDELLRKSRAADRQVFDVWALPWTSRDPALIRVWINSTLESRTWKCFVSQGSRPAMPLACWKDYVEKKDDRNQKLFLRTIGFDLYGDRAVFAVELDNSALIAAPTEAAAQVGIRQFGPIVRAAVEVCHGLLPAANLIGLDAALNSGPTVLRVSCDPKRDGGPYAG